ncbi:MAG: hypothetical protein SOI44_00995 [Lactimicrobium sp.]|jgi:hypothetical protein|uniref:hypothetical protein n=1 Tax=Lactimicrobium sp. TaxID=2563780 RepID=UPI002F34FE49
MKESCYFHDNEVILNYSADFVTSTSQLLDSQVFNEFLDHYLTYLDSHRRDLRSFLYKNTNDREQVKKDLKNVLHVLLLMNVNKVDLPYLELPETMQDVIEEGYRYWNSLQRFSVLYAQRADSYQTNAFMNVDNQINEVARNFFRTVEAKITGRADNVYRQIQAGTNASLLMQKYAWDCPKEYQELSDIDFVHTIMVRTPLIIHTKSNKRTNTFAPSDHNPIEDFKKGNDDWFCFPALVGEVLIFVYFHRDEMSSCVATSGLFQLAREEDCRNRKPDAILFFGNPDGTKDTVYYHDKDNHMWIGKTSASPEIDYFGYTKKSILTLHNLAMMERGWLPIHGAMVNLYLKDGRKKGLMFMGDSGAGKSETIEALSNLASDQIDHQETVFDDMGTIHMDKDGNLWAQGTEIGAFVRLDDLDKGTAYKDLDRSIFFNPDKKNARVVMPAAPYKVVTKNHPIDCFVYANNYDDKRGMHLFANEKEAEDVFIQGKRFALGTTQEKGLSTTFFANPFGPMQEQDICRPLIDKMFTALFEKGIPVGEVYTCLGLPDKGNHGIDKGAQALLDFVVNKED